MNSDNKHYLIVNALSTNNYSSINVLVTHLKNIILIKPNIKILIFPSLSYKSYERLLSNLEDTKIKIFRPAIFSEKLRALYEFIIIPFFTLNYFKKNSFLLSLSGYRLLFSFIPQIIYCQNPLPLIKRDLYLSARLNLKQNILFYFLKFSNFFNNKKDSYFFNSYFMKKLYLKNFKSIKKSKLEICYNPVNIKSENNNLKEPISNNVRINLLTISAIEKFKQTHLLFENFYQIHNKYENCHLYVVGPVDNEEYYNCILNSIKKRSQKNIHIYQKRLTLKKIKKLMKEASLYLSASACESFGMPAIEAQAFGVPSIVAPHTAASEIVGNGGLICNFHNNLELLKIIDFLIKNPNDYSNLSKNAIENNKKFSNQEVSRKFIDHFDKN